MSTIIKTAKQFLEDIGYDLSYKNIDRYITNHGGKICNYNRLDVESNEILSSFGLIEYARTVDAFAYRRGNVNETLVFVNLVKSEETMVYNLIHEIWHMLNHQNSGIGTIGTSEDEELEAKQFCNCVLRIYAGHEEILSDKIDKIVEKSKPKKKKYVIIAAAFALILLAATITTYSIWQHQTNQPNAAIEPAMSDETQTPTPNTTDIPPSNRQAPASQTAKPSSDNAPTSNNTTIKQQPAAVQTSEPTSVPAPTPAPTPVKTVCVTESGDKYHLPGCRYLTNRPNVVNMTINEARAKGYGACTICRPDAD